MRNRYYVGKVENGGSLTDNDGKPLPKQVTWGVFDRLNGDYEGEEFFPRCVADRVRREDAREECHKLNEAHVNECSAWADRCGCVQKTTHNVLEPEPAITWGEFVRNVKEAP